MNTLFRTTIVPLMGLAFAASACADSGAPVTPETQAEFEAEHARLPEPEFVAAWDAHFGSAVPLGVTAAKPSPLAACVAEIPSRCLNVSSNWTVKVRTADIQYAGTDAKVWIRVLYRKPDGTDNWTGFLRLDNGIDNFERNQVDTFEVPRANFGTPIGVELSSDGSGDNPGWYPTKISIKDRCSGRGWSAFYEGWMNTSTYFDPYRDLACGT